MNIYIMIGYSGCGKSTYAKKLAIKKNADIFCADDLFRENHRNGMTFRENIAALEKAKFECIKQGVFHNKNIILDGNFITQRSRNVTFDKIAFVKKLYAEFLKANPNFVKLSMRSGRKITRDINVIAIHINNEWDECTSHRVERDGIDWYAALKREDKDIPTISEGFYAIKTFHNDFNVNITYNILRKAEVFRP